jgi:hypothetical protein
MKEPSRTSAARFNRNKGIRELTLHIFIAAVEQCLRTACPGVVNGDLAARIGSVAFIHRFGALISRAADAVSMPVCETSLMPDSDSSAAYGAALVRLRQFDPEHLGRAKAVFRPRSRTFGDRRLWPGLRDFAVQWGRSAVWDTADVRFGDFSGPPMSAPGRTAPIDGGLQFFN